jgi:hypothetical protein
MLLLVLQLVVTVLSSSARAGSTSNLTVSDFVTRSSEICQVSDDVLASLLSVFLFCFSFSLFQEILPLDCALTKYNTFVILVILPLHRKPPTHQFVVAHVRHN